ncbi:MAG: class I SAM-dependent methyltransferase, partial [Moorea sp. SIO1F2]|uniref:class I SAM-dependent methyltransferase n=1 Tax=Moorena sp. SIO1F2 TaxID=2607819 RepID=UPI0013BB59E9
MTLTNDSFTDGFSDSVGTLESLQKSAIAYLFSDPRLQIVKLNDQEYREGQITYRSRNKETEMMLDATLQAIDDKMSSQEHYTILSIGCGIGIFEKPFLNKLLSLNKTIHFVGVDPNKKECLKLKEWCREVSDEQSSKFSFTIYPVGFETFEATQNFDIILFINSLYYFSEIEPSIRKSYQLLRERGMILVGINPKKKLLNKRKSKGRTPSTPPALTSNPASSWKKKKKKQNKLS